MKSPLVNPIYGLCLFAALAIPVCVVAQGKQEPLAEHFQHYKVTDLGTLEGGTFSQPFLINRYGLVSGSSSLPDGNQHATLWLEKLKVDIGAPGLGGPNSAAFGVNEFGQAVGQAETSVTNAEDFCGFIAYGFSSSTACLPFLWQDGVMTKLPTLGGDNGYANMINNRGVVAGIAETDAIDPTPGCPVHQFEAVIWKKARSTHFLHTAVTRTG